MKKHLWPNLIDEGLPENLSDLQGEFATEWDEGPELTISLDAPKPIIIPESPLFHRFDPIRDGSTLEAGVYDKTFGTFLKTVSEILDNGSY